MKNLDLRKTYILMYKKDNVKYIFNRSVDWCSQLSKYQIDVLNKIGYKIISEKLDKFIESHNEICSNISHIDDYLKDNDTIILQVCNEYPNIKLANQKELNKIKEYWCSIFNAVDRVDNLPDDTEINIFGDLKKYINDYIEDIYTTIQNGRKYKQDKYIQDITIKTEAIDILVEEYKNKKRKELIEYKNQIQKEKEEIDKLFKEHPRYKFARTCKMYSLQGKYIPKFELNNNGLSENESFIIINKYNLEIK